MNTHKLFQTRRQFIKIVTFGTMALATNKVSAKNFFPTPRQTAGPFYPDQLTPDTDNDLVIINRSRAHAAGDITHLTGRILGPTGEPVRGATVEIWHVDNNGIYMHTRSPKRNMHDKNFQGFGRFLTGSSGEYYFRTIRPVPYNLGVTRTPHIHFIVKKGERRLLTTQMYIKGHPMNEDDFLFQSIRGKEARDAVLVDFRPVRGSRSGELKAHFDIVISRVPEDPSMDRLRDRDGKPVGKRT